MRTSDLEPINPIYHTMPSFSWEKNQGLLYITKPLKENTSSLLTNPSHPLFPCPHLIVVVQRNLSFQICIWAKLQVPLNKIFLSNLSWAETHTGGRILRMSPTPSLLSIDGTC